MILLLEQTSSLKYYLLQIHITSLVCCAISATVAPLIRDKTALPVALLYANSAVLQGW